MARQLKIPRARNNPARTSLQNYFDRISNSLEDKIPEFLLMKKYARLFGESQKLLEIEKALDIAAGSIYEIAIDEKLLVCNNVNKLARILNSKNLMLKKALQGKPFSPQLKLTHDVSNHLQRLINNLLKITRNISRINEVIPLLKALLKMKDKENYGDDPILMEISNALKRNIEEPALVAIKEMMLRERLPLNKYDNRLHFEHLNDMSDKIIGLLNDKLLIVLGISEMMIAGVEDEGINDIDASNRLPDELMVLFLASSTLDIFHKIREIRNCVKNISTSIKICLKIMESGKLPTSFRSIVTAGEDSVYVILSKQIPINLKRILPMINETASNLDALDLKLELNTLDLEKVSKLTNGLIYEKCNRVWENPYDF